MVEPLSELELTKIKLARTTEQAVMARERARRAESEVDGTLLKQTVADCAPVREGLTFDWRVGLFRRATDGHVWNGTEFTADQFTPKESNLYPIHRAEIAE